MARHVLVVDDDWNILTAMAGALADEGLVVTTAADGASAIEQIEQGPPDLLVLDVTLPKVDSASVATRMRALRGEAAPVLVITADGRAAEKARSLHAYGYLRKPFDLARLIDMVERGLQAG